MNKKSKVLASKVGRIAEMLNNSARISFAAAGIASGADYCDFFVENGGDGKPFHEKCPTKLTDIKNEVEKYSKARMTRLVKIGLMPEGGGYCDFFVENGGDGKPFHEKCSASRIAQLASDPVARAIALSRTRVVQTLLQATQSE